MKRTFIAVPVPITEAFKNEIEKLKNDLSHEKIRWVKSSQMHITVAFLGDTKENDVSAVAQELPAYLDKCDAFIADFTGLGVFPKLSRARVLWADAGPDEKWMVLQSSIDKMLKKLGVSYDQKNFHPHLTLGRIKYLRQLNLLKHLLSKYDSYTFQSVAISEVHYYESILTPGGASYNLLKNIRLTEI